jgi:Zn-dependent protease with chaperone function
MNLMSHFSAVELVRWLADFYLPATLLMLVAIVARRWIRQPAQRLAIHWVVAVELAVLAGVCILPFWPRISLRAAPAQKSVRKSAVESPRIAEDPISVPAPRPRAVLPRLPREAPEFDSPAKPAVEQPATVPIAPPARWSWLEMAAAAYLASAGLMVAWLIYGAVAAARACRHAEIAPDSLREELAGIVGDGCRVPRLRVSSRIKTAVALGLGRPTILLPVSLPKEGSPQAIRAILKHEWAHIRNGDLWLLALGRWLLVLLFPHPLFWWLRRTIRGDQELLADAAAAGDNRPAYAEELLRLVRKTAYPSPIAASVAVGIWESSTQLSRRIAMLLDEDFRVDPKTPRRWRYRVFGLLAILGAACSLLTLQPARSDSPRPDSGEGQGVRASDVSRAGEAQGASKPSTAPLNNVVMGDPVNFDDGPNAESIALPVYRLHLIADPMVRRELKLTAEQIRKLHAIQVQYDADDAESRKSFDDAMRKKLPQQELAKLARKLNTTRSQWMQGQIKEIRKQAMEVLSPGQMELLKEQMFCELASRRLVDIPYSFHQGLDELKLAKEQNGAFQLLRKEANEWGLRFQHSVSEKTLSILTPEQKARLREEALGPFGPSDYPEPLTVKLKGESKPAGVFSLAPYPDFTQSSVRKELGLSAAQEQQVQRILGGSTNLTEKLTRELEKLSPQERKKLRNSYANALAAAWTMSEYATSPEETAKQMIEERKKNQAALAEQPVMKTSIDLRKQFEAMLTPKQLALYRDMAVRNFAAHAVDGTMLSTIGANKQQQAELRRFVHDLATKGPPFYRDLGRRLLQILTPAQQEALRAEFEKEITEGETLRMVPDQPANGKPTVPAKSGSGTSNGKSAPPGKDGGSGSLIMTGSGALTLSGTSTAAAPVAQPTPAAMDAASPAKTGSAATTAPPVEQFDRSLVLPVYASLSSPIMRKIMGIELSAEQTKKLRALSAEWPRVSREISSRAPKSKDPQEWAKFQATFQERRYEFTRRIEAVLTSEQVQAYWKAKLLELALGLAANPQQAEKLFGVTLTRQQRDKLDQIERKWTEQCRQEEERCSTATLAALGPQQRDKLRSDVEQGIRNDEEASERFRMGLLDPTASNWTYSLSGGIDGALVELPVYMQLGETSVAQQLALSAAQRKQLQDFAGEYQRETGKLTAEMKKLSAEERKRREFQEKATRRLAEARRQVETLLTPQQLSAIKEIIFRGQAYMMLADTKVQAKIALDDRQKADLGRINRELGDKLGLEAQGKSLDVLTQPQQEKLREQIRQHGS